MKARHGVMAAGLIVAGWLALFGDKSPRTDIAEPITRQPANTPASTTTQHAASKSPSQPQPDIMALAPRASLIGGAGGDTSASLFAVQNGITPPSIQTPQSIPDAKPMPPPLPPPLPPPTAPPFPYIFLGKKLESGQWEVFLGRGENTYIVGTQQVIDDLYRIDAITPPVMTITYLPLKQVQTLPIGELE